MQSSTQPEEPDVASPARLPASPRRALLFGLCALATGWCVTHWLNGRNELMLRGVIAVPTTVVTAPLDGRLIELNAAEYDVVHGGGSLALIENDQLASQIETQRQRVVQLQDELTVAEARTDIDLAWRQKDLQAEIHSTQIESTNLLKQKLMRDVERLAWNDFQRGGDSPIQLTSTEELFLTLQAPQFRSEEQQLRAALKEEASRNAAEVLDAQITLCDQRLAELRQLSARLPNKVKQAAGLERARNTLQAAEQELTRLEMQPQRVTLSAPSFGVVGVFRQAVGTSVVRGATIVELLDLDRPFLIVKVPSVQLHRFAPGVEVTIQFPGDVKRSGRVTSIPPQTYTETTSPDDAPIAVRIDPTGKLWPRVPVGSAVEVIVGQGS
jgi:multidrug resistance efflux pump